MSVRAFFAACLFLIGFSIAATAKDLTFTVRPGSVINAFDFGLKTRNFNPYCGADLF